MILIVDDNPQINSLLEESLRKEGHETRSAFSGTEAELLLKTGTYELVILDLMLPGKSGEEVIKAMRSSGDATPVIVLSAKDSLDSKVDVLSIGADDYVVKPFEMKELLARIYVQLRKSTGNSGNPGGKSDVVTIDNLKIDRLKRTVSIDGAEAPQLTNREFEILEVMASNPGRAFSKEELFEIAWDEPYVGETKTIDVHISNIRKKLHTVSGQEYIKTIWGLGYKMG